MFSNWKYGNCYTFNHGYQEKIRHVRVPGSSRGLILKLNIQSYDYTPVLSSAIGIKLVVHDQAVVVFPENDGLIVHTGVLTEIGINTVRILSFVKSGVGRVSVTECLLAQRVLSLSAPLRLKPIYCHAARIILIYCGMSRIYYSSQIEWSFGPAPIFHCIINGNEILLLFILLYRFIS